MNWGVDRDWAARCNNSPLSWSRVPSCLTPRCLQESHPYSALPLVAMRTRWPPIWSPSLPSSQLCCETDFLLQCLAAFSGTDIRDLELLVLACCVCGDSGLVAESCPTLAIPRTKEPGRQATVHEILQARILAWVPISFLRGPSRPRSWTPVSCFVGWFLTNWATREAHVCACVGSLIYRLGFNGFMINQVLNFIFWIFYKM